MQSQQGIDATWPPHPGIDPSILKDQHLSHPCKSKTSNEPNNTCGERLNGYKNKNKVIRVGERRIHATSQKIEQPSGSFVEARLCENLSHTLKRGRV